MKLLAVDTALGACSAAILDGDVVLAHRFEPMERGHAERLAPMVQEVMAEAKLAFTAPDRLAVTTGPGTFTGQRVGLAFMRGLRVALNKPLTGITTLSAMAAQAMAETGCKTAAAIHDARRGEVYLEIVGEHAAPPEVLAFNDALHRLEALHDDFALAGTAAPATLVAFPHAQMSSVTQPDAIWVARLAAPQPPTDTAPKPLYLRAPDAKLPTQRNVRRLPPNADLAPLAAIHAACFADAWTVRALAELFATPGTSIHSSDEGFILARAAAAEAEILTIAVSPRAQRHGLGRALVIEAASHAQQSGARAMFLEVAVSNIAARALYTGLGFTEAGRRKGYYARPGKPAEDALILRSNLPLSPLGKTSPCG